MTHDEYQAFKERLRKARGRSQATELLQEVEVIAENHPEDPWIHYLLGIAQECAPDRMNA